MRLDVYLTDRGLCKSRTAAQSLIKSGGVSLNGSPCAKPSQDITEDDRVEITGEQLRYAGRGGLKLEAALEQFGLDITGAECIDIGSSTGGFTDCMLQHGAAKVYAVDVGRDQLAEFLRSGPGWFRWSRRIYARRSFPRRISSARTFPSSRLS